MKSFNSTIVGLLFVSLTVNIQAQFTNLELLEHSEDITILTSLIHNKGDLIYVVTDNVTGRTSTQVKILDESNTPRIISDYRRMRSDSKYLYDSNGNLRIYLTDGGDPGFDASIADIIEIKETANGYVSNFIQNQYNSLETLIDISLDQEDKLYSITTGYRLTIIEEDILTNEIRLFFGFDSKLHSNIFGEVFLIDSNTDSIFKVNNLEIEPITQLPFEITDIKNVGDDIWALDDSNNLWAFDPNFSIAPRAVTNRKIITSLDQVSLIDSLTYILEKDDEFFILYQYDDGNLLELQTIQETIANSSNLAMISDTTFVTSGQYIVDNVANHAFIRGYNINQPFTPDRTNVALEDFDLFYLKDTIISGAPEDLWWYGINYNVFNSDEQSVAVHSIITTDLVPDFPYSNNNFEVNQMTILPSNISTSIASRRLISKFPPRTAYAYITGADYKFNEAVGPVLIDITTSTFDPESTPILNIFPNPFTSHINLNDLNDEAVSLYNMEGQLILSGKANEIQNVDLSYLNEGLYLLYHGNNKQAIKLMKSDSN